MRSRVFSSAVATAGLLAAAGASWASPAGGQPEGLAGPPPDDGPVIIGARRGVYRAFELKRLSAGFEFLAQYRKDTQDSPAGKLVDTEVKYQPTVDLSTEAYIGHKNLIDLTADLKLGLEDLTLDSDTAGQNTHNLSVLDLYDVRALILGESQLPMTAYTRRDEALVNRDFGGSIDAATSEYGAIANLRSKVAPTSLQVFHRETDQTDQFNTVDYHQRQDTIALNSNVTISDTQRLEANYAFDHVHEQQSDTYTDNYDRNDGTFTHLIDFGPENRHNLRSSLRVYDQTGIADQSVLRLDEQLRLHHSDRLESWYDGTLEDQAHAGVDQKFGRGMAHLRHKLYNSLVSTAGIGVSELEIPGEFTSDEVFVAGGLDYTKKVPLGRLNASAHVLLNTQDNSDRGSTLPVAREPHTFNDPFPVTISRRNIEPGSIQIWDLSGVPLTEITDYTVAAFPDRVEITRVVGGAISDGQTVLISYDIGPEQASTIDTSTYTFTLRYTFEEGWLSGLSPYMIYTQTTHDLSAEDPTAFVFDDVHSLTYGVDYRIGDFLFNAEQEHHDSTVQPFDAQRFEATYDRRLGLGSALHLTATHDRIDYTMDDNVLELNRLRGLWTQSLDQSLTLKLELVYRDESQTVGGSVQGFEEGLQVDWHKRQTSVYVSVRNSNLSSGSVDTTSQTFALGIRRAF